MVEQSDYVRGYIAGEGERAALATKLSDVRSDIRTFLLGHGPDARAALARMQEFAEISDAEYAHG